MNRLDTEIAIGTPLDANVTSLSPEKLASWSAEDFALAIELARAPTAFRSGLGDALIDLVVPSDLPEEAVAIVPLSVDGAALTLGLGNQALDALIGLLSEENITSGSTGGSATLSLDAIEALCVATVSPLMRIDVGRASWGRLENAFAALQCNGAQLSLNGDPGAVLALRSTMISANSTHPGPLDLMGQPLAQRLAVNTENVFALVHLNEADRANLERHCGIMLDTLWPSGRKIAGQRFVQSGSAWHVEPELTAPRLRVRSTQKIQMLDELSLESSRPDPSPNALELVDGEQVIATGHLTSVEMSSAVHMVFKVDQLI